MNRKLDKAITYYGADLVRSVCESVQIPSLYAEDNSGFPYGLEIAKAADHAMRCANSLGFKTTNLDDKVCWTEYGDGDEVVTVMGHLDIVAPGDGWTFDPFCGKVKDGYILGRGSQDDKGPVFSSLYALKAIADIEEPLSKKVRIIFGLDEENGRMRDVDAYLSNEGAPKFAFTPDGAYPVVNTEKGTIKFSSTAHFDGQRDGGPAIVSISGGESIGSVPAKAEAEIRGSADWLENASKKIVQIAFENNWKINVEHCEDSIILETFGKAAHATLPELGKSAIGRLLVLLEATDLPGKEGVFIKFLAQNFGTETDGTSLGIKASHPHCGNLTVNLAMLSGDASSMTVTCGIYVPAKTVNFDTVCDMLQNGFASAGGTFEPFAKTHPLFYDASHPLIKVLQRGYFNATGEEPRLVSMCGGTYSKRMPNMVPYGATFDDEDDRAHGADERLLISNLLKSTRLMAYAILEMAK